MSSNNIPTNTPVPSSNSHHQTGVILCILVSILLILVVAIVALAVVIVWAVRKRHLKQTSAKNYRPVPQEESLDTLNKALGNKTSTDINLPFPPRVQMTASKKGIQPSYTCASQITDHRSEMTSEKFQTRYPFIQHRAPSPPQGTKEDKRPPRLRTRRKGNHKHARGKNIIMRREDTLDSSPTEGDESRDVSPAHRPSITPVSSPQTYLLPARVSPKEEGATNTSSSGVPEAYIRLRYTPAKDLIIRIERVTNLPLRQDGNEVDAYVRVYFTPTRRPRRTSKTEMKRRSSAPVFDEDITFNDMTQEELDLTRLFVEALDYKPYGKHVLLGRAELAMRDVDFAETGEVNTSLQLHPPQLYESNGTVLLSLSFDPENRKLSLIVLRAKDLNANKNETDPVVKVTIELKDRVLSKLKTKKKTTSSSPIFNEAVSCTVGMENIRDINITVIMLNEHKQAQRRELGRIILGCDATGDEERHWNDIITSPGKHIAEWHELYQ